METLSFIIFKFSMLSAQKLKETLHTKRTSLEHKRPIFVLNQSALTKDGMLD